MTMKHFDQELLNRVSALESKFAEVQSIQSTEFDVPSFQSTQAVTESHPSDLVEEQTVADQVDTLAGNIGKVLTLDDLFSAKDVFSPEALCTIDSTLLRSPIVALIVGPEKAIFHVHKGLLFQSTLFRERVMPHLRASSTKQAPKYIELPFEKVETISKILEWLYLHGWFDPLPLKEDFKDNLLDMVDLHKRAHGYGLSEMKKAIQERMDSVLEKYEIEPAEFFGTMGSCYDKDPLPDDLLRKFFVQWAAHYLNPRNFDRFEGLDQLMADGGDMAIDISHAQHEAIRAELKTRDEAEVAARAKRHCSSCGLYVNGQDCGICNSGFPVEGLCVDCAEPLCYDGNGREGHDCPDSPWDWHLPGHHLRSHNLS